MMSDKWSVRVLSLVSFVGEFGENKLLTCDFTFTIIQETLCLYLEIIDFKKQYNMFQQVLNKLLI